MQVYVCLNCGSRNVQPIEGDFATGVPGELIFESAWRCLDCNALEDTVDLVDEHPVVVNTEAEAA